MILKSEKGSITLFVLVGLLFMTAFLIIAYGRNVNNSKIVKEQFEIISDIYMPNDNIAESYTDAYTDLRSKNKQILTYDSEVEELSTVSTIELNKTYDDKISNYRIYGNSVQNGSPTPDNPIEIQSVGIYDEAKDKYVIPIKISNGTEEKIYNIYLDEPLRKIGNSVDYIDFKEKRVYKNVRGFNLKVGDMNNSDSWPGWINFTTIEDFGTGQNTWINQRVTIWSNIFEENSSRIGVNTIDTSRPVIFFASVNPPYLTQPEWKNQYGDLVINICYAKPETIEDLPELPNLNTLEDDTRIEILTEVQPTRVVLDYTGYTID